MTHDGTSAPTSTDVALPAADAAEAVTLTIDDVQVTARAGETILEAARRAGIDIPALCHQPGLPGAEACRLCVVEIEGDDAVAPSCSTAVAEGMVVQTSTERVRRLRHLYLELLLSDHDSYCTPPCRDACPTHIKIPQFLAAIAAGDYRAGVRVLREDLPFPAVLGRVCLHPCQNQCRRRVLDEPVSICRLHGFMGEEWLDGIAEGADPVLPAEIGPATGKSLAVVGAGPAGLACAFYARLDGHAVTVFEALPKPGGVLRYGIPASRLPRAVLDGELGTLWQMGIELECGKRLGADLELADLKERFDAVFVSLGDPEFTRLGIDDEDVGAAFVITDNCTGCGLCLRRCPAQCISGDKKQVHVIDSAACIRCGNCRRVCKFEAVSVVAGSGSGDAAITAGHPDDPTGIILPGPALQADEQTYQTSDPRVFAAGDGVFGAQTVIEAIAQGKRAAWAIDVSLRGGDLAEVARQLAEVRSAGYFDALAACRDLDPRVARIAEIKPVFLDMGIAATHGAAGAASAAQGALGDGAALSAPQAHAAAELCLDCSCPADGDCDLQRYGIDYAVTRNRFHGCAVHDYSADFRHDFILRVPSRCIDCRRCVEVCRSEAGAGCYDVMGRGFDALVATPDNLPLQAVGCISCGRCATACPTGAIETNERTLQRYELDESRCIFCGECVEVCPYDALEQTAFFELAGYSRTKLADAALFERDKPAPDARRRGAAAELRVRDALAGKGWQWAPLKGDGDLDDVERDL
jgi:NADPH-dependent glutamate synthase beta subunit-like oxidoreductase/ferredoxin